MLRKACLMSKKLHKRNEKPSFYEWHFFICSPLEWFKTRFILLSGEIHPKSEFYLTFNQLPRFSASKVGNGGKTISGDYNLQKTKGAGMFTIYFYWSY